MKYIKLGQLSDEDGSRLLREHGEIMLPVSIIEDREPITLRDYFMAHAPAEPWAWYRPAMPPALVSPKLPDDTSWEFTPDEQARAKAWHHAITFDGSPQVELTGSPRLDSSREQWYSYWTYRDERLADSARERCLQWPAFWADQMLAQRGKGGEQS